MSGARVIAASARLVASAGAVAVLLAVPCSAEAETLLVVRKAAAAVDFLDPGSRSMLATVAVGEGPHEVSRSPDGRFAAVSNYGSRERPGSTLSVLDLEHPRELRRIELGNSTRPHGVVWFAPESIAVTTEEPASLLIVDPRAARIVAQIATEQAGSHMVAIAPDRNRAFVTNRISGSTTIVDLAAHRKLADVATGRGSEAIAITPDGGEVWVGARDAGTIMVFDTDTQRVLATIPLDGGPIRIAMTAGGAALATCAASGEVVAFDVRTRRETGRRRIEVSAARTAQASADGAVAQPVPVGISVTADGGAAFIAATRVDTVAQLELRGLTVLREIHVAGEPDGMALTPVMPHADCHACAAPEDPYGVDPPD